MRWSPKEEGRGSAPGPPLPPLLSLQPNVHQNAPLVWETPAPTQQSGSEAPP